jgi:hypothetical protein
MRPAIDPAVARFVRGILTEQDPQTERLIEVLATPTGLSSAGYPYLVRATWELFRDEMVHLFGPARRLLDLVRAVEDRIEPDGLDAEAGQALGRACRVVRQVVQSAAVTAPPDLWLMRLVLGSFSSLGLSERLVRGEALYPKSCEVEGRAVNARELEIDLHFLLARGIVDQYDNSYRIAGHPTVRRLLTSLRPLPAEIPASATQVWRRLFAGESLEEGDEVTLTSLGSDPPVRDSWEQTHWVASLEEVELGFRLVPLVLGLRACDVTPGLVEGAQTSPETLCATRPDLAAGALRVLDAAGWVDFDGRSARVTSLGARGFARGPGPFGIIETYHPYMTRARELLFESETRIWVRRGENIAASQDANRGAFLRANDALDRFCDDTGFSYRVFVEHAIGRGEATRQRYERSGEDGIRYFGADLEDAAIDAAVEEQREGRLPANMVFVRNADIGRPEVLVGALRDAGVEARGAVMMVGNGFHEVRDQTDERMVQVFREYRDAGLILIFTEENALSVDDLRATAWNTYHAGFKYVHEKSGQGLRPAAPGPPPRLGNPLRAPWSACAVEAGYVRADAYSSRTRTIFPYPRADGHNPPISVNHFFVPKEIAVELGLS